MTYVPVYRTPTEMQNSPPRHCNFQWERPDPTPVKGSVGSVSFNVPAETSLPTLPIDERMAKRLENETTQKIHSAGFRWIEIHVTMFIDSCRELHKRGYWESDCTCTSPVVPHLAKWYFSRFLLTTSIEVLREMVEDEKDPEQKRVKEWIRRNTQICVGLASKMDEETPITMQLMVLPWEPVGEASRKKVRDTLKAAEIALLNQLGWKLAVPISLTCYKESEAALDIMTD